MGGRTRRVGLGYLLVCVEIIVQMKGENHGGWIPN